MKKHNILFLVTLIIIVLAFSGCAIKSNVQASWVHYDSLEDLIKNCDNVIIGKVKAILPVERLNINELAKDNPEKSIYRNITPAEVEIKKVINGILVEGDTLIIPQYGGTYSGMTEKNKTETIEEIVDSWVYLQENEEYLMFLLGPRENTIIKYPVGLATPYVGYAKIIDGKIKVNKNNNLYDDGTSIDDMTKLVKEKAEKIK